MELNGTIINTMYAEHTESGINLYGANLDSQTGHLKVVRSTKNIPELAQKLYGSQYSNTRFIQKLKERPTHNFIGRLSVPVSFPFEESKISFVD